MAAIDLCPYTTLFSLFPGNKRAEEVFEHPDNVHLVTITATGRAFRIGFPLHGKSTTTLVRLGRGNDVDIHLADPCIARIQCSFEIDLDTGVIMFYDRSHGSTSQVFGANATPFEFNRPRRVVVARELNDEVGMGGKGCDLIKFNISWCSDIGGTSNIIIRHGLLPDSRRQHPREARTVDSAPTELPSHRETRLHTPGSDIPKMRYQVIEELGSGSFGQVYRAVDIDTGKLMAVKVLQRPPNPSKQRAWNEAVTHSLRREIDILASLSHPNIVDYIASQGWFDSNVEIFMGLKDGTLESLIEQSDNPVPIAETVFPQMLRALDCLACKDIVHRDVKPENILYILTLGGQYQFQLGDFGTSNRVAEAVTFSGSPIFMAPEVHKREHQSCKVDVWSLFVTLLWTLDINGFRQTSPRSAEAVQSAVLRATTSAPNIARLVNMTAVDPLQRASAAQMLVLLFNGEGLSTPRNEVPPLYTEYLATEAGSKPMARASTALTARDKKELSSQERTPVPTGGIRKRGRSGHSDTPSVVMY